MAQTAALSPGLAGHVAAVLASLLALLALLLVALLYVKCRLNVLLWYQDKYGEVDFLFLSPPSSKCLHLLIASILFDLQLGSTHSSIGSHIVGHD